MRKRQTNLPVVSAKKTEISLILSLSLNYRHLSLVRRFIEVIKQTDDLLAFAAQASAEPHQEATS